MTTRRPPLSALFLALLLCGGAHAQTVYKCSDGGATTYADRPCEHGASRTLPPPVGVDPNVDAVRSGDARTLLETEKLREQVAADKRKADNPRAEQRQAEQRKAETQREERRAERGRVRVIRVDAARRKRCDRQRLRVKWAQEDLARAPLRKQDAARTTLRRRQEAMAVECRD